MDRVFATNGVGTALIMTASMNHLTYEAIRERKGCQDIMEKTQKRKHKSLADKKSYDSMIISCTGSTQEMCTQFA